MESIRVKSKDAYIIEVNDNGDTIEFDLTDIGLPFALERAYRKVQEATQWLRAQQVIISKKPDVVKKGEMISAKERETLEAYRETFKRMRAAIDDFAGEGASEKIFGQKNYLEMFNDFMDAMSPHFEKMKMQGQDIRARIAAKYGAPSGDEL